MAQAVGFGFDASFMRKLAQAEEKLLSIQKTSNDLQNNTIKSFQQITQQGVVPYVDQLLKQKQAMEAISKIRLSKNTSDEIRDMKQQAKDAVKEINKLVNVLQKTEVYKQGASGQSAISFANSLIGKKGQNRSIDNLQKAISNLEQAQRRVNTSTKEGRKNFFELEKNLLKTRAEMARLTGETNKATISFRPLIRGFASWFGIQSVRGFVNKMIDVRKELERQNKALQIILGNKEQANRIWDQTVELAVKSPFTIQELTRYTRQLAAYRIETSKLYETNKMLADVSAGLGVDMQRLILAFGQIKSASYLRGTELRQLTEAGVPMLVELSKHFTELYGRVVTVDEAFGMISKRQVSFKDVEQVFKNMTSEGGVFFNMQEQMSNTLHGKISNLKDSISLMLNDIGMDNEGIIHSTLDVIKKLVDNWRLVAAAIKTVIVAYGAYQLSATIAAFATGRFGMAVNATIANETAALASTNRLTRGLARLKAAFSGGAAAAGGMSKAMGFLSVGLPTLIISAIAGISMFTEASEEASDTEKRRNEEMEQNIEQLRKKNETLINTILKLKEAYNNAVDNQNIIDQKIQLQKLIDIANEEYRMKIIVDVEGMTPEEIAQQMLNVSNRLEQISSIASIFSSQMEEKIGNKLVERSSELSKATQDLLTLDSKSISSLLGQDIGIKEGESTEEYLQRLLDIRSQNTEKYNHWVKLYNQSLDDRDDYLKWVKDAGGKDYQAIDPFSFWGQSADRQKEITAFGKMALALDKYKLKLPELQGEFNEFLSSLNIENAQTLGILDESIDLAIRQFSSQKELPENYTNMLIQWANSFYGINLDLIQKDAIQDWQKRFNEYLNGVRNESAEALQREFGDNTKFWSKFGFDANGALSTLPMFDEKNADMDRKKTKEKIEGQMENAKDIIDAFEKGVGEIGAYTENEYKFAKIEYEHLQKALEFFGGKEDKSAKKRLQEQIKLLEEMHKKYLELKKTFGDEKAESEVKKAYSDTFAEVFKDTGISFDAYKTFGGFKDAAAEAGADAGEVLTEEMQAKIKELTDKGVYIRSADNAAEEFTKSWEQAILKAKDVEGLGKGYTIGYGEYNTYKDTGKAIQKSDIITQEEASERFSRVVLPQYVKGLNAVLDANKDLIFTQEQYNALLDMSYQGGADEVEKLISYARDEESALAHVMQIREKFAKAYGEEEAEKRFGESFVKQLKESENIYERMALLISTMNLTVGGEVRSDMGGMLSRTEARAQLFSGDLDIAQQLEDALVTMDSLDFMTKEGMVAALNRLKELAKKAGPEVEKLLSKTISGYEAEIGVKMAEDADKELREDVQDLFDRHSLTVELKKLQVPPTVAKNLFGVDFLDNAGLKSEVIETYTKNLTGETKTAIANELAKGVKGANWALVAKKLGDEQIDQIKKDIEKVDDLEEKALKERMKKYVEYSRKSLEGAGKIRLEQLQKMMDIEETFKTKDDDTDEVRATKAEEKARALNRASEEANEAIMKLQWEDFRKSETFTSLFDDLDTVSDKVLDDVITRLENFKKQWKDLPIDQMKEVDALLRKAKRAKDADDNPWGYARDLRKSIKNDGRTVDEATIASATAEQEKARLEEELRMMELIQQQRNLNTSEEQLEIVLGEKYKYLLKETLDLEKQKAKIAEQQGIIDNAQDRIQDQKDLIKAYEKQNEAMQEIDKMAQDLYDSFKELYEAMGQDDAWVAFVDAGMEMSSMVLNTIALQAELNAARVSAEGFGLAMNTAMGVIGWIVMGVQILTKAITAIAEYEDKLIEQEVEKQTRAVNEAIDAYEQLEEAIENAYSTEQIREYSRQMDVELQKAIDAQKAIIKARKSAKHSGEVGHEDWEALKEAEEALEELEKRHEENLKSMTSTLTDGILDSVHDAAREFTDAWYEAFKETGNGLSGLEENFEEMFLNLAKSQAAQQITGEYVKNWQTMLKDYIDVDNQDTEITPEQAAEWAEKVKASFPELSAALEGFLGVISEGIGERGGLSELQKGIQGVTEQTAQVLEALLNSMRDTQANAYQELQKQTRILVEIRDTLDAVSGNGPRAFSVRM